MRAPEAEPFPRAVHDALDAAADRPVFEHGARVVTGAELLDLVARIAAGLRGNGLDRGDGVALLLGVNPEAFATILAAHVVGTRVLGVRPGLPDAQLRHLLDHDIAAVVTDSGGGRAPRTLTVDALRAARADDGPLRLGGRPGDVARLIHTSGSTGMPKACAQTYAAMTAAWAARPEAWPPAVRELASRLDRFLVFGSLSSQVMFEYAVLTIAAGGTVVVADRPALPEAITRHRASASVITVPRLAKLVAARRGARADLSTLRALLVSGSPLDPDRHREALEVLGPVVFHGYGQSETGMIAMATPDDPPGSVGVPPAAVDVEVRDAQGDPAPAGVDGELFVRTPEQAGSYWADPVRSAEVFTNGWVRTRDLGHLDADGHLYLTGRTRDVVIVNANPYYAGPIERVIAEHPDVSEAYVVAAPDEDTGEAVHAFVVPTRDRVPDLAALRALVTTRLGAACAPTRLTAIAEPPLAPSGKPDKRLLSASRREENAVSSEVSTECLVIGAGPAGLQASYLLSRAGRDHLVLEAGDAPGTFFTRFPRHRKMISINKPNTGWDDPELNLRTDWNSLLSDDPSLLFTGYTPRYFPDADDLVRYLADFAAKNNLPIRYGTSVVSVSRPDDFVVRDQHGGTYRARRLIVATGVSLPYLPPIDGVEHAERYEDVSVDAADFTGQRVLIVGRGNSAFETADNLIETAAVIHVAGPGSLRLAWQTHFVGHLRAVNNNFLDTYQLKSQNALLDGQVLDIRRDGDGYLVRVSFARVAETVKEIRYDRVIVATGFRFDASIFAPECRPELTINGRFPDQNEAWESVNVPDLFFAGTITQARDFKKSTSGFIHGFRYGVRALHRILEHRYHGVPWPSRELAPTPAAVVDAVIERVNRASALWQLFAFMADAVLVGADGALRYAEEVPVAHLHEAVRRGEFGDVESYLAVTLEYGEGHDLVNPFDITAGRVSQEDTGGLDGRYLHPVVRHFRAGVLVGEHHLTENLENEWDSEQVHRAPLLAFLHTRLARAPLGSS